MANPASIRFKTRIDELTYLSGHYLGVPASIVKKVGGITKQRLLCTVNKSLTWQCGLVALGAGKAYIIINKKQMKVAALRLGQQVNVELRKDPSEYGMVVPEELQEVFDQDKEGKKRFDGLVPGKRRYIIYYVKQVKSSGLRIERAVRLIENLKKLPEGKETFVGILAKSG